MEKVARREGIPHTPPGVFCSKSLEDDEKKRVRFLRAAKELVTVSKQSSKLLGRGEMGKAVERSMGRDKSFAMSFG